MIDGKRAVPNSSCSLPNLSAGLLGIFGSPISGGKRLDRAAEGRRLANATFYQSHAIDSADQLTFAPDLSPLCHDEIDTETFLAAFLEEFRQEVAVNIQRYLACYPFGQTDTGRR